VDPATVTTSASSAGFVASQTSNFTSVRRFSTGIYCVAPGAGINPAGETAAVSGELSRSGGVVPLVVLNAQQSQCGPGGGEFQVETFNPGGSGPANGLAFTILAP
jgi:hypothetical protein